MISRKCGALPVSYYLGQNTNWYTALPLLVATLNRGYLSNKAINLCCCYYYQCIYFSLSIKATSLMWPQFLGKYRVALLERDYCNALLCTQFEISTFTHILSSSCLAILLTLSPSGKYDVKVQNVYVQCIYFKEQYAYLHKYPFTSYNVTSRQSLQQSSWPMKDQHI